jgi:hypothetical protein
MMITAGFFNKLLVVQVEFSVESGPGTCPVWRAGVALDDRELTSAGAMFHSRHR